ncbi:hypothetical protein N7467_005687 [Penicillium canescens]|nr:hypothetical protein N7467_005687 [Penicillium canescens]
MEHPLHLASSSSSNGSSQNSDDAPSSIGRTLVEGLEEELEVFFNEGNSGSSRSSSHSSLQTDNGSPHESSQGSAGESSGPGLLTVEGLEAFSDEVPNGANGANGVSRTPSLSEGPAVEEYLSPTITVHETGNASPPGTPRQPSYSQITEQGSDNKSGQSKSENPFS